MNTDTPFVEYLIIGSHTFSWLLLITFGVFNIPISVLNHIDASVIIVVLPLIYLLGMLFDSIIQYMLDPFRQKIRDSLFDYIKYKDEFIALKSSELYNAYEVRVRRVRVIGAAIFNWPILGITIIFVIGVKNPFQLLFILGSSLILCLASIIAWRGLYRRAYKFRKNACDLIQEREEIVQMPQKDS